MNLKDYLTPEQVKAYATTPRKALEISIKHHWQNTQLTEKQFSKLSSLNPNYPHLNNMLGIGVCGLCVFNKDNCPKCIITKNNQSCMDDDSLYVSASNAGSGYHRNPTSANWGVFIKAEKKLHKFLCSLRSKQ